MGVENRVVFSPSGHIPSAGRATEAQIQAAIEFWGHESGEYRLVEADEANRRGESSDRQAVGQPKND